MDISPKKQGGGGILTLYKLTSMAVRECRTLIDSDSGLSYPKRKGRYGRKRKTTARADNIHPQKNSRDPQRNVLATGANIDVSTMRRRLLEAGWKARKPIKKAVECICHEEKSSGMGKKVHILEL